MKKNLLFIVACFIMSNVHAQDQRSLTNKGKNPIPVAKNEARFQQIAPAAVIYTQDFAAGLPADWAINDNGGNGEIWTYTTGGPQGASISAGDTIVSPTASNGFMIMDDDFYGDNGTVANTDLISGAINCSANPTVKISFYDFFRVFTVGTDLGVLYVSNDSVNWTDIYHAETGLASNAATPNPHFVDLDITAVAANQATVYLKFNYQGDWGYFWEVDDIEVYEPAAVDGGVSAVSPIIAGCGLSATTPVTITINNYGANPISNFPVSFAVNGGTPVVETYTATIAAGTNASYTFTGTADLSAAGPYTISAYSAITGDANATNDSSGTSTTNFTSIPVLFGTPFSEGFESVAPGLIPPTGWTLEDTDGDLNIWDFINTYPYTGTMAARLGVAQPLAPAAENWLFSPCLDLSAGTNYIVEYFYKSFALTATSYELESRFGTSASSTAMVNNIAVESLFPDSSYHYAAHVFTVPANGSYHMGFNGFGSGIDNSLRIDDISVSVSTGIKELTDASNLLVGPNPSKGLITVAGKIAEQNMQLVITNSLGQPVYNAKFNNSFKVEVDLTNFASGIYAVQLVTSKGAITKTITLETK